MKSKLLFFLFLLIGQFVFAQKGTVQGLLTDKEMNNEPLPFANVMIKGTTIGTTTDENGKYELSVDAGSYILVMSFLGYETIETPIQIKANQTITVNKTLSAGQGMLLQDVVVETVRRKNTEAAIMLEVKEAKQVVSAISAEQMQKGTDSNAAQVVQRVPGVTIIEGRFVMVRGLSERYNNVLINNAVAPSTEVDKRTFSFDLIPTSSLDKIVIYKTGSADLPGDFSGGIIKLTTSDNISDFTRVGVSFGYRNNTTFKDYNQSEGSPTDFLGFDNGFRALPSGFPTAEQMDFNPQVGVDAANSLQNNFNPRTRTAFLDNGVGFSMGRNIALKNNKRLMTVNSLSYSNSFQTYDRQFNRYFELNEGQNRPQNWFNFIDDYNENEARMTVLSNWILRLNDNNVLKFKNVFNQIGENQTTLRNGLDFQQQLGNDVKNYMLGYRSRSIYSGQLEGEHKLNDNQELTWVAGANYVAENEPDLRRFRTFRPTGAPESDPFEIIEASSSNLFDTGRYFGQLNEIAFNNGANYTYSIKRVKNDEELADIKLKTGYYIDYRNRDFNARYVTYRLGNNISSDRRNELKQLPLNLVFAPQNVNVVDGWGMREGTREIDSYSANNLLTAGYLMAELPLGKFDITTGVRIEHNILELNSVEKINYPVTSFLPSLNVGYSFSEKSLLRTAYSRTVNRPEFREIAPFIYYSYEMDANFVGTSGLEIATIDNFDLRYEMYPRKGETISFGAFYKYFDSPIEYVTQVTTENPLFLYKNADNAYNYGLELEIRKSFEGITSIPFFSRLSSNINLSYIRSNVDLGEVDAQERNRALQGQSPYIINAAVSYDDKENDLSVSVIYNRIGNRIFAVGDTVFPTIYELSRDHLDVTVSKKVKDMTFKLGIQDVLNSPYRFYQDTNRDVKINTKKDDVISAFKRGTLFNLAITYDL
jgi:TonB-dependent receptor